MGIFHLLHTMQKELYGVFCKKNIGNNTLATSIVCVLLFASIANNAYGQLILSQDFESVWTTPSTLSPAWSTVGTGNNQWQKNSYTTGWSNPILGLYTPTGVGSCGTFSSVRFHSYDAASATTGDLITPTINFSAAGTKTLSFWMINTSGTDKVDVYLSTDNGGTYGSILATYTTYANWTFVSLSLGTSTATQCKVRFRATSDFGTTDIGIDRVNIVNNSNAMNGIYTIDNSIAASATNYTCFTTAIADVNERGINAAVTFNVKAGQTFTEDAPILTATGTVTNTITFQRSGTGVNPIIKPTGTAGSNDAGIYINGGDYFIFDGIDINIATGAAVEYGYYLTNALATNGAQNNTIKNAKIILNKTNTTSYGIFQSATTTPSSIAGANSNNKFYNFTIENCYNGIYLLGNASFPDLNSEIGIISGGISIVGGTTAGDIGNGSIVTAGIRVAQQQDVKIFNCEVRNVTGTGNPNVYGIWLETAKGTTLIYNNKVHDIASTSTGTSTTIYGIRTDVAAGLSANVFNNFVYNIFHALSSASSTQTVRGIAALNNATGSTNVYYNSVKIETANSFPSSTAFYTQTGIVNLKNNIFSNFTAGAATSKRHAIFYSSGSIATSDYNDLYVVSGTNNFVGNNSSTDRTLITDWRTATSLDANSINADPQFISTTNLHINTATGIVDGKGNAIIGYATDIDGDVRCVSSCTGLNIPDIGADEYTYVAPACPTIPTAVAAGSITASGASISFTCTSCTGTFVVEYGATGFTPGTGASAGVGGTVVAGAGSPIVLSSLSANTNYDVYVRNNCSASNYTANATKVSLSTPCGILNVPYTQNFDAVIVPAIPSCMAVQNVNADAYLWQTCTATSLGNATSITPQSGNNQMGIRYNGSAAMDDWFYLPAINLTNGTSYRLSFFVRAYTYSGTDEQLEVKYGTTASAAGMTTGTIFTNTTIVGGATYTQKNIDFTPSSTGVYYIGFHGLSALNKWYLFVDDISLTVTPPTLTATTLTSFGNVCTSTTAGPNSFTITGTALTSANVTVAAVTGFTYSTTAGGTYTSSLTLTQSGGAYSQTIYVKFNPTLVQSYNANITVGGAGATNISVTVIGSGVNSTPTVTSGTASSITINSATVAGAISAIGCSAINAYGIEWSTTNGFANGAGTGVASSNLSGSNFSSSFVGLTPGTTYYYHAYAANAAGTSYGTQGSFTTLCAAINVPYTQNFDGVTLPTLPACMLVQDVNVDTYTWKTCDKNSLGNATDITPYSGNNQIGISYNFDDATIAMNDWFYLPALNFIGGTSYRLTFYTRGYTFSGDDERMEIKYGTSATAASMTSGTIMSSTLILGGVGYTQKTFDFTPASNGVYYVGFHGISDADLWYLFVDDISVTVTPPCNTGGTATAANASICGTSGTTTISAINYSISGTGLSYQWQSSTDNFVSNVVNITGATTPASLNIGTITSTTYYRLRVYCTSLGNGYSNIVTVAVTNPLILSTIPATRCGIGTVNLQATASSGSVIKWYTAATGGGAIGTGSPFTTPAVSATTTFYVAAAAAGASTASVGPTSPTTQGGTIGTQTTNWRVYFDVTQATTLQSVDVFPITAGQSATLYIFNAGGTQLISIPYTTSVSGGSTAQTIPINLSLVIGTGYNIYASGIPTNGLKRNTSGAVYPYTSSSINITGNGYDNTYFMCYYNWKFSTGCEGGRTAVTVTVTPPPALALTSSAASICSGNSTVATVTAATIANFTSYSWLPNVGVIPSGTPSGSSATLSPIVTTTYVLSGSTVGGCVNQASIVITVNPAPPVTVGAAVCSGTNATISASSTCANFTNAGTAIPGSWNAATDPVAIQPVIFLPNSTTCEFDPNGNTMNYTTTTFQVSVSGTYTFAMDTVFRYDGMGYIVTGAFVPGTCPGSGTWVVGDDDSGPSSLEPLMTANLSTGIIYTLVSTCYYSGSSTVTDSFNWTITPPTGGQITTVSNGSLQWYTVATGGTAIASGTTFNPVGVAGSGVANNTSVGNYTFYAACTNNTGCRTATGYSIGATGQWTGANNTVWANSLNWCDGVPSISTNVIIANGAPNMPVLGTGTGTVNNLTVLTGATLTIANATMQIAGAITAAASTITASTGTIELKGTATQSIAGSAFVNRNLLNLIASNSVTVSAIANDTLRITGALSFGNVNSKTFNASDNITLVSNATGTARVADITNNGANTGNVVSGKFVVERYIPARRAWRLITAPIVANAQTFKQAWQEGVGGTWSSNPIPGYGTHITGGTLRTTAQGYDQGPNNPSLYAYNGTAWNILPTTTNDALSNYQGYMLFVRGSRAINLPASTPSTVPDNTVLRPTGAINTGLRPAVTNVSGGFTVVANPYPSAINFNNVNRAGVIGGTGGNNAYYLWDPYLGGNFGYGSFIAFSWNGVDYDKNIGPSNIDSAGIISSGAAFMVNLSAGGSITFDENDKVADGVGSTYLFRPIRNSSKLRTTLFAHNADGSKALNDGVLVTFNPQSSNDVNNEEAFKINNFAENFCVLHQGKNISIERRKNIGVNDTLFFNMWNMKVKKYELQIDGSLFSLPANTTMYFEDTYLKQEIEIPEATIQSLLFDITTDSKSAAGNRFRLVFKNKKVQNILPVKLLNSVTISPNPIQYNTIHVTATNLPIGNYNIKIVQVDGKVIEMQTWLHNEKNNQIIVQQQLAPANYFLEISNNKIKKIAIPFMVK